MYPARFSLIQEKDKVLYKKYRNDGIIVKAIDDKKNKTISI